MTFTSSRKRKRLDSGTKEGQPKAKRARRWANPSCPMLFLEQRQGGGAGLGVEVVVIPLDADCSLVPRPLATWLFVACSNEKCKEILIISLLHDVSSHTSSTHCMAKPCLVSVNSSIWMLAQAGYMVSWQSFSCNIPAHFPLVCGCGRGSSFPNSSPIVPGY